MSQQREHVKKYLASLARWKDKNLGEQMCHTLAAAVAREKFPLSDAEQREVDAWLNEKYPVRVKKSEHTEPPSLFDDLPTAW